MKILAIDPGINNFAYSLIDDNAKIILKGHLGNPIQDIKNKELATNIKLYKWDIEKLIQESNLENDDKIIIERYQPRGYKGIKIECINIMIGIIADKLEDKLILILPSTWKTYIKKKYYKENKKLNMYKLLNIKEITGHIADSIGIASYVFEKHFNNNIITKLIS